PALASRVNYFIGDDAAKWQTDLPVYSGINYDGLYTGVTLKYEGAQGLLKGTYMVATGADPDQIRWQYTGAARPRLDASGNLLVGGQDSSALLTEQAPVAWQEISGKKTAVDARYLLAPDGSVSFALG